MTRTAKLLAVIAALSNPATSFAAFSSVSIGYSAQQTMRTLYQTLGSAGGIQASATYEAPSLLGKDVRARGSLTYHSYKVTHLTDAKINFVGTYVGLEAGKEIPKSTSHLHPTLGVEIGLVYDSMSLSSGSTVSNSALVFGTRIVPGIRTSLFGVSRLIWGAEFPIAWTFGKNALTTWSGVINLGWAL